MVTSITIECIVTKREHDKSTEIEVARNEVVFVALDERGEPKRWKL